MLVQQTFQQGHPVMTKIAILRHRGLYRAHEELPEVLPFGAPSQQLHTLRWMHECQRQHSARGLVPVQARKRAVICLAHVTNQMGTIEGDFEKGEANGTADALAVVSRIVARLC
jgi:hypothetical protein